jgi:hypothetical protein
VPGTAVEGAAKLIGDEGGVGDRQFHDCSNLPCGRLNVKALRRKLYRRTLHRFPLEETLCYRVIALRSIPARCCCGNSLSL